MANRKTLTFALAILALVGAAAASANQALTNCKVNLHGDPNNYCCKCYDNYCTSSKRQTCYNCLVNHRNTPTSGASDDCYSATDDNSHPAVYAKCSTSTCFNCLTNFANKGDAAMDLCKMIEPRIADGPLRTAMFNCLSNTQGAVSGTYPGTNNDLPNSKCFACTHVDCTYCITNLIGNPRQAMCSTCAQGSGFWGCVYAN